MIHWPSIGLMPATANGVHHQPSFNPPNWVMDGVAMATSSWINGCVKNLKTKPASLLKCLSIINKRGKCVLRIVFNPFTAKLFNLNFHPIEVVSRWRDPQLQVSENYLDLTKWRSTLLKSFWLMSHLTFNIFKTWYLICANKKIKPEYMRHRRLKG